ncbi:hypothetical protein [Streptomyces sp. NPDC002845]
MNDAEIIEIARMIRPYLAELVGDERSNDVDAALAAALADAPTSSAAIARLRDLFSSEEALLQWAEDVLEHPAQLPPEFHEQFVRGGPEYSGLPGHGGGPIPADRFVCPVDQNYVWYRPHVGVPVPACKEHSEKLVKAS